MAPCKAWASWHLYLQAFPLPTGQSLDIVSCNFPRSPFEANPLLELPSSERAPSALPMPRPMFETSVSHRSKPQHSPTSQGK